MTYVPHLKVKPQVLAEASVEALYDKLVVSNTVTKKSDAKKFYAAEGDTITQKVKGTLPVRSYTPRNDRSQPIITDEYSETKVSVTIKQDRPYSAIKLTDEQRDWDFQDGWADILDAQTDTIAGKIEQMVFDSILDAPYEAILLADDSAAEMKRLREMEQDPFFNLIVDGKTALKKMRTPGDKLFALVGLDLADKIVKSNRLVRDIGRGSEALTNDSLGVIAGVQLVASTHVPADQILMYAQSGFMLYTGTASVPSSVPFGTTVNANGFGLRWLMDYDTAYLTDRSVLDTFAGTAYTKDRIAVYNGESQHVISDDEFFVRGLRMGLKGGSLGDTNKLPGDGDDSTPGGNPNSWLAKAFRGQTIDTKQPQGKPFPLGGNYPVAKLQAKAEATVAAGKVTAVAVTDSGSGYASTPEVTFTGEGTGAAGVAVLANGQVKQVVITSAGDGYTAAPAVEIAAP